MKAGKHLQMGGVGAVLFASAALAGAPVAFDAGVVRNAPGLEPKPFAAENGSMLNWLFKSRSRCRVSPMPGSA